MGLLAHVSCRKIDSPQQEQLTLSSVEEKFFNSHCTSGPPEKALVDFLKRKNGKLHFVEKTASQIGFPRWYKVIVKGNATLSGRTATGDSATLYYVPFVRDSQNYVNASMVIRASTSDTSFSYLCDWHIAINPMEDLMWMLQLNGTHCFLCCWITGRSTYGV